MTVIQLWHILLNESGESRGVGQLEEAFFFGFFWEMQLRS